MEIKGKTVIVTGGGTGIGRSLSLQFAAEGAEVGVLGRRKEPIEGTAAMIRENSGRAIAISCDVTDAQQVDDMYSEVSDNFGEVDIVFNNAGSFNCIGAVHEVDIDKWWTDVRINMLGPFVMMRHTLAEMIKRDSGLIINMNGGRPTGGSAYASSKAGLMELTRITSAELCKLGSSVVVMGAGPGLVHTEMTQLQVDSEQGRKWIPSTAESIEEGKVRSAEDIAIKTIEVVKKCDQTFSGKYFGPETEVPGGLLSL